MLNPGIGECSVCCVPLYITYVLMHINKALHKCNLDMDLHKTASTSFLCNGFWTHLSIPVHWSFATRKRICGREVLKLHFVKKTSWFKTLENSGHKLLQPIHVCFIRSMDGYFSGGAIYILSHLNSKQLRTATQKATWMRLWLVYDFDWVSFMMVELYDSWGWRQKCN